MTPRRIPAWVGEALTLLAWALLVVVYVVVY